MSFRIAFAAVIVALLFAPAVQAACPVTNTFVNGTIADAAQVNQNFADIVGCVAPSANPAFTGNVQLVGSTSITMNGYKWGLHDGSGYLATVNAGASGETLYINDYTASPTIICASIGCGTYSAFFDLSGRVGIGTQTPAALLSVGSGSQFQVDNLGQVEADTINTNATNDPLEINFKVAGPTKICASVLCATFSAYFDTNGRVGIGTTSPQRTLDVGTNGQITFGDNGFSSPGNPGIFWYSDNTFGIYKTAGTWDPPNYQQLEIRFDTGVIIDGGSGYPRSGTILQPNGGKVGIGTTSPLSLLSVGSANQFQVDGSGQVQLGSGGSLNLNGATTYGLRINSAFVDSINAGGPNDTLEINYYYANATKICASVSCGTFSAYFDTSGRVGIGTTAPAAKLVVSGNALNSLPTPTTNTVATFANADSAATRVLLDTFGNASNLTLRRANNTAANPSVLGLGDLIGQLTFFGYGSSAYSSGSRASIFVSAAEGWSDTAQGTYMVFSTTTAGTTTTAERLRIDGSGNVGIGTTTPGAKLHVVGGIRQTACTTAIALYANTSGDIICNPSDARLKNIFGAYSAGLESLAQITPQLFSFKATDHSPADTFVHAGFIAQDVMPAIPQAVVRQPNGFYALDTTAILAATVNSVKQLKSIADRQSAEIADLKDRLAKSGKLLAKMADDEAAIRVLRTQVSELARKAHSRTARN